MSADRTKIEHVSRQKTVKKKKIIDDNTHKIWAQLNEIYCLQLQHYFTAKLLNIFNINK